MKKLFKSIVVVAVVLISNGIFAQAKKAASAPLYENSLLWEISGKGLSKTSYLYGTIHMICADDYFLSEKVKKAFESSDKLVLEVNLSDPTELAVMQQMAIGKETLDKALTPDQLSKLDGILKEKAGLSVQQVNSYSLSTVMSLMSMKTFNCVDLKFYEMEFIAKAKERGLEIAGFESVKAQLGIIEKAYTVDEMLAMFDDMNVTETSKLVSQYKNENIQDVYSNLTDVKSMNLIAKNEMLDKRNANWVQNLSQVVKDQSAFIAVGAAHLGGDLGVINLLRKAGYTVKPIMK
ncbi:MAG: TraB/GumN family protein [Bacteroidetes bacterium]|nr:TraB/GumN family protein [Bacteroidota bacterium]